MIFQHFQRETLLWNGVEIFTAGKRGGVGVNSAGGSDSEAEAETAFSFYLLCSIPS